MSVNTRLAPIIALVCLFGCAPSHPFTPRTAGQAVTPHSVHAAPSTGYLIHQQERPIALLLDELTRHGEALQVVAGGDTSLSLSIDALVMDLEAAFAADLYTGYAALTPAQQQTHDEVTVLVEELRILVGRALSGAGPQNPEPRAAIRLS